MHPALIIVLRRAAAVAVTHVLSRKMAPKEPVERTVRRTSSYTPEQGPPVTITTTETYEKDFPVSTPTKVSRLKQPSTWAGLVGLLSIFGVMLSPEQAEAIAIAGAAIASVIFTFTNDTGAKK
jgi:hypothetical protein